MYMVIHSKVTITIQDEKGNLLYSCSHRKSKAIKIFVEKAIKEKWVLKEDIFGIVKNTMQFKNIWEYFEQKNKIKEN